MGARKPEKDRCKAIGALSSYRGPRLSTSLTSAPRCARFLAEVEWADPIPQCSFRTPPEPMLRRGFCFQPLRSLRHAETPKRFKKESFEFQVVKAWISS